MKEFHLVTLKKDGMNRFLGRREISMKKLILNDIWFYNVDNLEEKNGGYILNRFPQKLMDNLGVSIHTRGRFYSRRAIGSEIRFKTKAPFFDLCLESIKEDLSIHIFIGDFSYKKIIIKDSRTNNIHIEIPEKFLHNREKVEYTYSPYLIRVVIGFPGYVCFKSLDTFGYPLLPITENDHPNKTVVIYGSSISHGSEAIDYINSSAFIFSRLTGYEVLNKAIPGSCQGEKIMIDYLKTLEPDAYFIEFGVNVLGLFTIDEFKKRVDYIVQELSGNLYLTSIYDNSGILEENAKINSFRNYIGSMNKKGVKIIPPDVIKMTDLTTDLLHPSEFGQMKIALRLMNEIKI